MESVFEFVNQLGILNKAEIEAFTGKLVEVKMKRKDYIVKAGQVCRNLYFLKEGAVRAFYLKEGKEIVTWFVFDGEVLAPFYSFTTQQPGIEYVQLIEDSAMYAISYEDLEVLYAKYHRLEHFGRKITEQYYRKLEDRMMSLQLLTAKQRYQQLVEETPQALQRVPLGSIASYLGISQETLSRVRKQ